MAMTLFRKAISGIAASLSVLAVALAACPARALDPGKALNQCRLDTWTTRDGLPPRDIEAIAQTPDGYLWLATRAGLVRFDGVSFKLYNSRNTVGFKRDMVRSLAVTRAGELWLGTDGGGFGRFQNGRFYPEHLGKQDGIWYEIRAIYQAQDESLWFGGLGGPHLFQRNNGVLKEITDQFQGVVGIAEDRQNNLWFAVNYTGLVLRRRDGTFRVFDTPEYIPSKMLSCLCLGPDGSLWVGTEDSGLVRCKDGRFTRYTTQDGLSSNEIHALYTDRQGNLWIGTRDGLDRWVNGTFRTFRKADGLADSIVGAILEDREGNLWVGSGAGLNCFHNTKLTPFELPTSKGPAAIRTMCQTPDGSFWFATDDGLKRLCQGRITTFTTKEGLLNNNIQTVWVGPDNRPWLLDSDDNLIRYDGHAFRVILRKAPVYTGSCDKQGLVLFDWTGIHRLKNGRLVSLPLKQETGFLFMTYCDRQGTLWLASTVGLGQIKDGKYRVFHDGLPRETHVLAIDGDAQGTLWLGTDKGLARFRDGHIILYTLRQGLPDDNLYQLLEDRHGTLWIGGNRGIFTVSTQDLDRLDQGRLKTLPTTLYDAEDGIRRFPVGGSAFKAQDGTLWFKGDMGITIVDPDHIPTNPLPPPTRIEQVEVDHYLLDPNGSNQLPPGRGKLEIHYTGLSFVSPEQVRFRYKLEGFDKDWVEAGTRRTAYYTNLPPGDYCFRVLACNNEGVWNKTGASVRFTLAPHFYQTAWFRVLCLLTVVLLGGTTYGWRVRRLNRRNRELEARVLERTAALREANARLEALATTDGMTGLANHRAFQERLRQEMAHAQESKTPLTLLLLDVDHFKEYNDTYGHPAGDDVLRRVAALIRQSIRTADFPARYGGEEFAVLLPSADAAMAREVAERIRVTIAGTPFPARRITISLGACSYGVGSEEAETLVLRADQALYVAKRDGRNCVRFANDPVIEETDSRPLRTEAGWKESAKSRAGEPSAQAA